MASIGEYLTQLTLDKKVLVDGLNKQNLTSSHEETFTTLVGKIANFRYSPRFMSFANIRTGGIPVNVQADLSTLSFRNLETLSGMFSNSSFTYLKPGVIADFNAKDGSWKYMFKDTVIWGENTRSTGDLMEYNGEGILDLRGMNSSNITNVEGMFHTCVGKAYNVFGQHDRSTDTYFKGLDFSSVTKAKEMFYESMISLYDFDFSSFVNVTDASYMFASWKSAGVFITDDADSVTEIKQTINGEECPKPLVLKDLEFNNLTNASYFAHTTYFDEGFKGVYLENLKFPKLTTLKEAFRSTYNSTSATTIMRQFYGKNIKIDKSIDLSYIFYNQEGLTNIIVENDEEYGIIKPSNVTYMCCSAEKLKKIKLPVDLSACTSIRDIFSWCYALTDIEMEFDLSACTSMEQSFMYCRKLVNLPTFLNTDKVTRLIKCFNNCLSLVNVSIDNVFPAVTTCESMFSASSLLETVSMPNLKQNATCSYRYMFQSCPALKTVDLSSLVCNAASTYVAYMFSGCSVLEKIDMRSFDFTKITSSTYYSSMLNSVPKTCQIIVMNDECKAWFASKFSSWTNVVTVAELEAM